MTQIRCYCGKWNDIDENDLGSEDFVCNCGHSLCVPETFEEVAVANDELNDLIREDNKRNTLYRIMVEGENGTEFTVRNNVPEDEDLIEVLVDGYRYRYPEARRVFTEPEENVRRTV